MRPLRILFFLTTMSLLGLQAMAQNPADTTKYPRLYLALGGGLDYGGFGTNATAMLIRYFGLQLGVGYNLNGTGVNGGGRIYFTRPYSHTRPYFSALYGYNTVIIVRNATQYNKTFYGGSVGFGMDIESRKGNGNAVSLGFYIPIRKTEVKDYLNSLQNLQGAKFDHPPIAFGISVGYRFALIK